MSNTENKKILKSKSNAFDFDGDGVPDAAESERRMTNAETQSNMAENAKKDAHDFAIDVMSDVAKRAKYSTYKGIAYSFIKCDDNVFLIRGASNGNSVTCSITNMEDEVLSPYYSEYDSACLLERTIAGKDFRKLDEAVDFDCPKNSTKDFVLFDSRGNEVFTQYVDGSSLYAKYDENNNRIYTEDHNGRWNKYDYDENNNLIGRVSDLGVHYDYPPISMDAARAAKQHYSGAYKLTPEESANYEGKHKATHDKSQDAVDIDVNTRVVDSDGLRGIVTRINRNNAVLSRFPSGLYYVSHDLDDNGYKVGVDGWYGLERLTVEQAKKSETSKKMVPAEFQEITDKYEKEKQGESFSSPEYE